MTHTVTYVVFKEEAKTIDDQRVEFAFVASPLLSGNLVFRAPLHGILEGGYDKSLEDLAGLVSGHIHFLQGMPEGAAGIEVRLSFQRPPYDVSFDADGNRKDQFQLSALEQIYFEKVFHKQYQSLLHQNPNAPVPILVPQGDTS